MKAAGAVTGLPLATTRGDWGIRIEGREVTPGGNLAADWQVVTPGYFEAMGTPLDQGRLFTDADRADTLPVIVINETMARVFWPGINPLGRRLTMGGNTRWLTIVGIVADVRHRGLDGQARAEMYRPHTQFRFGSSDGPAISAMTLGDPDGCRSDCRGLVRARRRCAASIPISASRTSRRWNRSSTMRRRTDG